MTGAVAPIDVDRPWAVRPWIGERTEIERRARAFVRRLVGWCSYVGCDVPDGDCSGQRREAVVLVEDPCLDVMRGRTVGERARGGSPGSCRRIGCRKCGSIPIARVAVVEAG